MKTCSVCGAEKKKEDFRLETGKTVRRANCRKCDTVRHKVWRSKHREHLRQYDRGRWQKKDRWLQHIKRKFGITEDLYKDLLYRQGGGCAICGTTKSGAIANRFHIDHDHKTGAIRGLLCGNCNRMLGSALDSPDILARAIDYLTLVAPQAEAFVRAYMETTP